MNLIVLWVVFFTFVRYEGCHLTFSFGVFIRTSDKSSDFCLYAGKIFRWYFSGLCSMMALF